MKYYDLLVALSHARQKVYEIEQQIEELLEDKECECHGDVECNYCTGNEE